MGGGAGARWGGWGWGVAGGGWWGGQVWGRAGVVVTWGLRWGLGDENREGRRGVSEGKGGGGEKGKGFQAHRTTSIAKGTWRSHKGK